jgi:hypothetical protein
MKKQIPSPENPAVGHVWLSILDQIDKPGSSSEWISVNDSERGKFHKHPWSIGAGGAAELKADIDSTTGQKLSEITEAIGVFGMTNADEVMLADEHVFSRQRVEKPPYFPTRVPVSSIFEITRTLMLSYGTVKP